MTPVKISLLNGLSESDVRLLSAKNGLYELVLLFLKSHQHFAYTQIEIKQELEKNSIESVGRSSLNHALISMLKKKGSPIKRKASYFYYSQKRGRPKKELVDDLKSLCVTKI